MEDRKLGKEIFGGGGLEQVEGQLSRNLDIEVLEFEEIPTQIRNILTEVKIKYGYLIFGDKAIKFPEPPIEIAKKIIEVWNEILTDIYKNILEEYKQILGNKELKQEDLEKLGIVLGRLPEVELRRHIGKYEEKVKKIIEYVIGEKLAEKYFPKMTMQQMFFNIYSILTLVLYSTPLHELIKQQKMEQEKLRERIQKVATEKEKTEEVGSSPAEGGKEGETNPFLTQ